MSADLTTLLPRLEAAGEGDQHKLLTDCWLLLRSDVDAGFSRFLELMDARAYESAALALVSRVLPGWWIAGLGEDRTPIIYAGDEHRSLGTWRARIQHRCGGRLTEAQAKTPALALCIAAVKAKIQEGPTP